MEGNYDITLLPYTATLKKESEIINSGNSVYYFLMQIPIVQ